MSYFNPNQFPNTSNGTYPVNPALQYGTPNNFNPQLSSQFPAQSPQALLQLLHSTQMQAAQFGQLVNMNYLSQPQMAQFQQPVQVSMVPQDSCALCSGPLTNERIFLEFDSSQNKNLFACSNVCKNLWFARTGRIPDSNETHERKSNSGPAKKKQKTNTKPQEKKPIEEVKQATSKPIPLPSGRTGLTPPRSPEKAPGHTQTSVEQTSVSAPVPEVVNSNKKEPMFVIVDTNALIEHLGDILNLKQHRHITLVIPMIVIQELDHIQKKEEGTDVGNNSRSALRAILDGLRENQGLVHKWMRGQASYEIIPETTLGVTVQNNDDQILNCVLYYKKYVCPSGLEGSTETSGTKNPSHLLLLTNDTALSVKSLMNGVPALNVQNFLQTLPPVHKINDASWAPILSYEELIEAQGRTKKKLPALPIGVVVSSPFNLPTDIWKRIAKQLNPSTLLSLNQVNRFYYGILNDEQADDIWADTIRKTFNDPNGILFFHRKGRVKDWYIGWRRNTLSMI